MMKQPVILPLAAIILLHTALIKAVGNSVCNEPGYYSIRTCAQGCIGCADSRPDQIAYMIGCGYVPPNECWCATDLFTLATSALKTCVSVSCTIGGWESDYSAAEGFYASYCERSGFTGVREGDVVVETTTEGANLRTTTRTVANGGPTGTSNEGGDGDGDGEETGGSTGADGLTRGDKIALGVGIGLGLPATVAGLVTCIIQIRARLLRDANQLRGGHMVDPTK